jgi:transposase
LSATSGGQPGSTTRPKIRIVLDGLRGETSIAELYRREGVAESIYYSWSKEFLEAGKRRLAGDTARAATTDEVKQLRREAQDLKEVVAEQALELRAIRNPVNNASAAATFGISHQNNKALGPFGTLLHENSGDTLSPTQFGLFCVLAALLATFFDMIFPSSKVDDFSVKTSAASVASAAKLETDAMIITPRSILNIDTAHLLTRNANAVR